MLNKTGEAKMGMPNQQRGGAGRPASRRPHGAAARIALAAAVLATPRAFAAAAPFDMQAYNKCTNYLASEPPAPPEAEKTCSVPANQGVPGAQYALGAILVTRDKVPEAVPWLEKAARARHPPASYLLARLYLQSDDPELQARGKDLLRYAICTGYPPADTPRHRTIVGGSPDCSDVAVNFEGSWVGRLSWVKGPASATTADQLRVTIAAGLPKVYLHTKDGWEEVKPSQFLLTQLDETAVVSAVDSGWDIDGKWVETWTIYLQRVGDGEAMMTFVRTVINPYLPESTGFKTFFTVAAGRASRAGK